MTQSYNPDSSSPVREQQMEISIPFYPRDEGVRYRVARLFCFGICVNFCHLYGGLCCQSQYKVSDAACCLARCLPSFLLVAFARARTWNYAEWNEVELDKKEYKWASFIYSFSLSVYLLVYLSFVNDLTYYSNGRKLLSNWNKSINTTKRSLYNVFNKKIFTSWKLSFQLLLTTQ